MFGRFYIEPHDVAVAARNVLAGCDIDAEASTMCSLGRNYASHKVAVRLINDRIKELSGSLAAR